ncbi:MAG TPA: MarR family transcriptional regulator [Candidatus Limnocylindria bacterium]|nr:MarR family transcriptional regulator [Candidatus Limnocylindria bacterium]
MASSLAMRARALGTNGLNGALVDLETRATKGDHQALRLWLRLLSCTVRIENHVRGGLRQNFATTLPRFDLMAQLERHTDGLRMSEVSKRLMVSGGNVTGITDQLEREGLVIRTLDRSDRRALTVKLTETGLKRFREMATQHEQWIVELFRGLSSEERQLMFHLLQKLKAHLSGLDTSATSSRKVTSLHRRK